MRDGDEILVIDGDVVAERDISYIESVLRDRTSLCLTVRTCVSRHHQPTTTGTSHLVHRLHCYSASPPAHSARRGYCYRRCSVICLSVCVLGYTGESCRNGGTDRDAVWHVDSGGPGPRNCVLHEAPDLHTGWDNFWIFNPLKKWQLPAAQ